MFGFLCQRVKYKNINDWKILKLKKFEGKISGHDIKRLHARLTVKKRLLLTGNKKLF